jgi:hypothetical protein
MAREGVPLNVIQRQLGHTNLGVTSIYLQGIDNSEIIETVHARAARTLPASAGLRLQAPRRPPRRLRLRAPRHAQADSACCPVAVSAMPLPSCPARTNGGLRWLGRVGAAAKAG